jgi:hypothetical protein
MNSLPTGWMRSLLTAAATAISPMISRFLCGCHRLVSRCSSGPGSGPGQIGVVARSARARDKTAKKRTAVDRAKRPCNTEGEPWPSRVRRGRRRRPRDASHQIFIGQLGNAIGICSWSADRGGRVAPAAADPSHATGRVKRRDNQLHRARVLEVRIQSPPGKSPQTIGSAGDFTGSFSG